MREAENAFQLAPPSSYRSVFVLWVVEFLEYDVGNVHPHFQWDDSCVVPRVWSSRRSRALLGVVPVW